MHRLTAQWQWGVELPQRTASLPGGSRQCNSCNAPPHRPGAVGSGTPAMCGPTSWGDGESCPGGGRCLKSQTLAMCCHTTWGQWAVELLSCTATLLRGSGHRATQLLQCTASLPGVSAHCNSCNTLLDCLGPIGSATPAVQLLRCTASLAGGRWQCNSYNTLPHCLGVVGSRTPTVHYLTTWEWWAMQILQCTATSPGGSGQLNSCNALPLSLGAVRSATHALQCHTASGRRAVELLQCAGPPARGTWTLAQEAVAAERADLVQCTATLPGRSGRWNSCNAQPHYLGAVGTGPPVMHCHTPQDQ